MTEEDTITRTEAFILAPQVRTYARRRYAAVVLAAFALGFGIWAAVQRLAFIETWLATEGEESARAIVYEVPVGQGLQVPLEPRTDVIRFVVHAYQSGEPLAPTPHEALVRVRVEGSNGTRTEELRATLPGVATRVATFEPDLAVGDPLAFDVDVHDMGTGRLVVELVRIDGATGVVARAYRRERLSASEALLRDTALDRKRKDALARWEWELGWDELTPPERANVLATRWHRLGKLRDPRGDLRSLAVELAPKRELARATHEDVLIGRVALRGDERLTLTLHRHAAIRILGDPRTLMQAMMQSPGGGTTTLSARGELRLEGSEEEARSVEIASERDSFVDVRAPSTQGVDWLGRIALWRVTSSRPAVLEATADTVWRVSARQAIDRRETATRAFGILVETRAPRLAHPLLQPFTAERSRSRVDRYDEADPNEAPSERAVFYVAVPRGGSARISSGGDTAVDLTFAELDDDHAPRALRPHEPNVAPLPRPEGEPSDDPFVPRRPSNLSDFSPDARITLRVGHPLTPRTTAEGPTVHTPERDEQIAVGRVRPPTGPVSLASEGVFLTVPANFALDADARRPLVLPIDASAGRETLLSLTLRPGPHAPARIGLYRRWTLPRTFVIGPETRHTSFVVGDDVGPDATLVVTASESAAGRIHVPWVVSHGTPRWTSGQFEE